MPPKVDDSNVVLIAPMELVQMLDNLSHFEFLTVSGAVVAAWVKFQNNYGKLSARVRALETDTAEFKSDMKQLLQDIQEIKLLLAKNKVE